MLARSDRDFVLSESRPRRRSARKPDATMALLRTLSRHPGRTVVGASSAALAVGIILNAMVLQTGPHPAPFFRSFTETSRPAGTTVTLPVPQARPVDLIAREIQPPADQVQPSQPAPAAPRARPAPVATGTPAAVPVPQPRDSIADLLKTTPAPVEPSRSVLFAQKALAKLNYGPIKPDGLLGAGTRQAIERFERDRRIPVTGELGPRTLRELSAASGLAQD